jgi:hypothetical protein
MRENGKHQLLDIVRNAIASPLIEGDSLGGSG